jgi:hypothetical protein
MGVEKASRRLDSSAFKAHGNLPSLKYLSLSPLTLYLINRSPFQHLERDHGIGKARKANVRRPGFLLTLRSIPLKARKRRD